MLEAVLSVLAIAAVVLWVGGAVTGQVWMVLLRRDPRTRHALVPLILWTITRVYIPAAAVAGSSVAGLVLLGVVPVTGWLLALAAVFALTMAVGSLCSLPEYRRLAAAIAWGDGGASVDARLIVASWMNRVELCLIAGLGAMVLASAV